MSINIGNVNTHIDIIFGTEYNLNSLIIHHNIMCNTYTQTV